MYHIKELCLNQIENKRLKSSTSHSEYSYLSGKPAAKSKQAARKLWLL